MFILNLRLLPKLIFYCKITECNYKDVLHCLCLINIGVEYNFDKQ